jgi:sirohydrochlorin ferrochelatase
VRNPVRSESDAFYIAVGSAVVLGASVALGALVAPLVGVALVVGALAGALIWELASADPDRRQPLREAAAAGERFAIPGRRRVLVVANRTLQSETLRAELAGRVRDGAEVHVVVPILASRIHYVASDIDAELREARERLADVLAWARAEGLDVTGRVGDPSIALGAIEDELRLSGADEVILSTLPRGRSNWLETGIVERLREELDIPITHKVVDLEDARATPARQG